MKNSNYFKQRRKELLNQIADDDIVIIPTSEAKMRNGDVYFHYRADSDFYYLTGFAEPEAVAVFCPGRPQGEYILFCREHNVEKEMWDGRRAGLEGAVNTYGADDAFPIADIGEILPGMMEQRNKIYTTVGRYPRFDTQILSWINKIKKGVRSGKNAPYELVDLCHLLYEQRLIKRREEVDLLRKAAEMSAEGHTRAMQICKPGMFEYEVQAEMELLFRKNGSHHNAYSSIVAGGANACILHYIENNQQLKDGDLLLIDAGAEFDFYAADISRTFPVNGKFTPEQRDIYELVLAAQSAALDHCRVGGNWNAVHEATISSISQGLLDLNILNGSLDEVIDNKSYTQFFMHRTGHWIGMDVHDVGDYRVDGEWRDLEEGMAFTVEPGLYFQPADNVEARWHHIGVRIEDDILITKNGHEVLSAAVVKHPDDIEALMAG